ncbi:MAG: FKBP-type peptidyl-prolyl cis-trans isomerase [Alysiella sp.]|uniref:FKBP-type peptidyl-prolyl cis-trans isomerase n=1 Tax=Alysiella sp. TaxID=1872483 RepID=UPI0026DB35FD|nr:FKBP-type peptidyl-prolyl cis-trans isomerase [Alysiella sp.]MDO4433067.1 FKBP-type peptidyl-prolyl cis-trans isomerase [Alysiella sp.]
MKKHTLTLSILATSLMLAACNQNTAGTPTAASGTPAASAASAPTGLGSDDKQLSYLMGYEIAAQMQLAQLQKAGIELDKKIFMDAMQEQMDGKTSKLSPEQAQTLMQNIGKRMDEFATKEAAAASEANGKFLTENKAKEGVQTTASGLQYKINQEGTGAQVALGDLVSVEYEGRLTDGRVFDSTKEHGGQAFEVPLAQGTVIPGWIEGLQLMKEGGEYTLYIPANLAYGAASPSPKIPANSVLVFDMKITKVEKGGAKKVLEAHQAVAPKK